MGEGKPGAGKKKGAGRFMNAAVVVILVQVFAYTWAHLIFSFVAGVEIAPVVSVAFYGFCGAEAGILAVIKKWKIKNAKQNTKQNESEENENAGNGETDDYSETDQP